MSRIYADDYSKGDILALGSCSLAAAEIIEFATRYDPQPYHLSQQAGEHSSFGGLIASGWQIASAWMGLYVRTLLPGAKVDGSPGVDELRWYAPVRPGDVLVGAVEVLELVPNPFRKSIVTIKKKGSLTLEGADKPLMTLVLHSRFQRRPAGAPPNP
ncbi:MAG: MaoC/PaaZ C-terminal domain-containing protein [Pseudomonadota bacterium]